MPAPTKKTTTETPVKGVDAENKKTDAAQVAKREAKSVKDEERLAKKQDAKGLRPVKHYEKAATSTDDFVKQPIQDDGDDEIEDEDASLEE